MALLREVSNRVQFFVIATDLNAEEPVKIEIARIEKE